MTLDHDDLILLARLLGNHTSSSSSSKIGELANRLLAYSDHAHPGGRNALEPIDLILTPCKWSPGRVIFREKEPSFALPKRK